MMKLILTCFLSVLLSAGFAQQTYSCTSLIVKRGAIEDVHNFSTKISLSTETSQIIVSGQSVKKGLATFSIQEKIKTSNGDDLYIVKSNEGKKYSFTFVHDRNVIAWADEPLVGGSEVWYYLY